MRHSIVKLVAAIVFTAAAFTYGGTTVKADPPVFSSCYDAEYYCASTLGAYYYYPEYGIWCCGWPDLRSYCDECSY